MSKPKLTSLLFLGFIGRIAETLTIAAYNKFFGNRPYQMISFAYNSQKEFYTASYKLIYWPKKLQKRDILLPISFVIQ